MSNSVVSPGQPLIKKAGGWKPSVANRESCRVSVAGVLFLISQENKGTSDRRGALLQE